MKELKESYNKAVEAYIREFGTKHKIDFEGWVGDLVGEVVNFADYYFNFADVKYTIDNKIRFDWLSDWYYFILEFEKCYYNLDAYCRLRRDAEKNELFKLSEFEKGLIYKRLQMH